MSWEVSYKNRSETYAYTHTHTTNTKVILSSSHFLNCIKILQPRLSKEWVFADFMRKVLITALSFIQTYQEFKVVSAAAHAKRSATKGLEGAQGVILTTNKIMAVKIHNAVVVVQNWRTFKVPSIWVIWVDVIVDMGVLYPFYQNLNAVNISCW